MANTPGAPEQLSLEQARVRLKLTAVRLREAYELLSGQEWYELEGDLPLKAAIHEAQTKAREGFAINELARRRLAELAEMAGDA